MIIQDFDDNDLDEQEIRIKAILKGVEEDVEILRWQEYLTNKLKFPFQAEIYEYQEKSVLQYGDILNVSSIEFSDDLYGVLVKASKGKKKYTFPLCDLEEVDKSSDNHEILDDYCTWFSNWR